MDNNALVLAGIDTAGLTEEQKAELAQLVEHELEISRGGMDLRPTRFKVNKDSCTFVDPFGKANDELKGVVIFKQKTRGLWERGENVPLCSSMDGVCGTTNEGERRLCANCPHNAWGSGRDESGNQTRGKACKEMRRAFIVQTGAFLPVTVTFPPTSLGAYDDFFSARIAAGVPDVAQETILRLVPQRSDGGFAYAQVQCKLGAKVPPLEMLRLAKMRDSIKVAAEAMGVDSDDYPTSDQGSGVIDPFTVDQQPA